MKKIIILTGPTASGKSEIAVKLAQKYNGTIINADSMQFYQHIPIITAQPTEADLLKVEHKLYNLLDYYEHCSIAKYNELATKEIQNSFAQEKLPIIVGGTGLYIKVLIEGLSPIPNIEQNIRLKIRNQFEFLGKELFYQELLKLDPLVSGKILPTDSQRMIRAMEVIVQTGSSIVKWQQNKKIPTFNIEQFKVFLLNPIRATIYENCNKRFLNMLHIGALEEIKNLQKICPNNSEPIYKALAVKEINDFLSNKLSYENMVTICQQKTRQYAKRQITWFKHQLSNINYCKIENFLQILTEIVD